MGLTKRTQQGNFEAEQKLCFARLNRNHWFRNCTEAKKCLRQDCEVEFCFTVLIKFFDEKKKTMNQNRNVLNISRSSGFRKGKSQRIIEKTVSNCNSWYIFGWQHFPDVGSLRRINYTFLGNLISLASRLKLVGEPIHLHISGFNAKNVIETHWVKLSRLNRTTPICSSQWNLLWKTTFPLVRNVWRCLSCRT